jgi:hypothetical protein
MKIIKNPRQTKLNRGKNSQNHTAKQEEISKTRAKNSQKPVQNRPKTVKNPVKNTSKIVKKQSKTSPNPVAKTVKYETCRKIRAAKLGEKKLATAKSEKMRKNSEDKKGSEIQSKLNRKNLEQFM